MAFPVFLLFESILTISTENVEKSTFLRFALYDHCPYIHSVNNLTRLCCTGMVHMFICCRFTGNLKIITDSQIRSVISKGPKYRFPAHNDFNKCRDTKAIALNDYCTRWCK